MTNNHPDPSNQAEEIVTTIGQAFEIAFQRFKESKKAQEDFKALKAGVSGAGISRARVGGARVGGTRVGGNRVSGAGMSGAGTSGWGRGEWGQGGWGRGE